MAGKSRTQKSLPEAPLVRLEPGFKCTSFDSESIGLVSSLSSVHSRGDPIPSGSFIASRL